MNSLDAITLKAFLVALTQLEDSLSAELQGELNALGKEFPSGVSNLHVLAKGLAPLEQADKVANPASIQDNSEFEAAMEAFAITRKNYRNAFRELAH
ncbi:MULTISPECIES: hypothetical protein [unclassified Moorena]|uniref:hypothetical protein n=1 Tax=unclassified Moorena TaxID=2683338 RepID=UPI0025D4A6FE|nr:MULTISPECIES: hypothetical protein [unclassified Moorena]